MFIDLEDTLFGQIYKKIPNYYPDMYKEYESWQVKIAHQREMEKQIEKIQQQRASEEQSKSEHVYIQSEAYLNGKKI